MDTYDTLEKIYVHDVYSKISSEFDVTRKYHWKSIKSFLTRLPSMCKGIDIGCGNGRNMMFREDLDLVGIDKCPELVEICKKHGVDLFHDFNESELKKIYDHGKIPCLDNWPESIALDDLMTQSALQSFSKDQNALDDRIRSFIN